jgi:hypothetical protein
MNEDELLSPALMSLTFPVRDAGAIARGGISASRPSAEPCWSASRSEGFRLRALSHFRLRS